MNQICSRPTSKLLNSWKEGRHGCLVDCRILVFLFISAETGFRHVKPEEYTPRLLHFHGVKKNITVKEVPLNKHSLDTSDVFILDLGLKIFQVKFLHMKINRIY